MTDAIAIVGMACEFPDARSPDELWENVLSRRRAFRRMPAERLRADDYLDADPTSPDRTYAAQAAVIADYDFARVDFRVSGPTFRATDLTHWLALDVAGRALTAAGFANGDGAPRDSTGVFVGNTLTGEFSRAGVLRLRWPFVRRVVEAALERDGWSTERRVGFLTELEQRYKEPFPPVGEESLAGGLSNTIAGRICNYFNFRGGGYTVDGACASSLLAVTNACSALSAGDVDLALAGGVDLSLDPFELVGFAKAGALAADEMRVYDAQSSGFWPGEGCGFVTLMRLDDARRRGQQILAIIRGWGISSDGQGGMTRPEVAGQVLALQRAYRKAGFGIDTVAYFEGHGTGTAVGDATELRSISLARRVANPLARPAVISSIKANIGHTKAAAGVAGLIKAVLALQHETLPPVTACDQPHPELDALSAALRVAKEAELWPTDQPLRAGVGAMGFGGINVHIALEGAEQDRRIVLDHRTRTLSDSAQDAELILLGARDAPELLGQVEHLLSFASTLSRAEVTDLAAACAHRLSDQTVRAAIVVARPTDLVEKLERLKAWLIAGELRRLDPRLGVFLGDSSCTPRLGFLFPGQGSPNHRDGGALRRRFASVRALYETVRLPTTDDERSTDVAQPAIVAASLAALRVLHECGVSAEYALGHSLGELTSLHWAGGFDAAALVRIAAARGRAMAGCIGVEGAMASLSAGHDEIAHLINGDAVVIAGLNSPRQTVISGAREAITRVVARAEVKSIAAKLLPVSHAFHSPLMVPAEMPLAEALAREELTPLTRKVLSTVSGGRVARNEDLRALLLSQLTKPVRFTDALMSINGEVDLWIEVGPGAVLRGLAAECCASRTIAVDAGGPSLVGLLTAVGAAFASGSPIKTETLFGDRFHRPFDFDRRPRFFANPCESAPVAASERPLGEATVSTVAEPPSTADKIATILEGPMSLELVRRIVSERAELPLDAVKNEHHLLSDLHLNSITVSQLMVEAGRQLGLPRFAVPANLANATVAEVAQTLENIAREGTSFTSDRGDRFPDGLGSWVRPFAVFLEDRRLGSRRFRGGSGEWHVFAPSGHPLAEALRIELDQLAERSGVVVCLPPEPDEEQIALLLQGAQTVLAQGANELFVLVQHGGGAAAFARSLHLEEPRITCCVVDVPTAQPEAIGWILAEIAAAHGYTEAHYDHAGTRREPVLRLLTLPDDDSSALKLGPGDVLLVTGGGKGIAADCALGLAQETGAALALIGRSLPDSDVELSTNLERLESYQMTFRYISADITDADAVAAAVHEFESELGPITAILHAAGTNVPCRLGELNAPSFRRTFAAKVQGARNLLAAVDASRLRLFVTFGSIIARTGMTGQADYALANEWLTRLTERFQVEHPGCRCLAVEWSVWSDVGMGERLGRIDALAREGIAPIKPAEGVAILRRLMACPLPAVSVIATSRISDLPTLRRDRPELPFLRFLEHSRIYYPGVELVVDADLSTANDPYLSDHVFQRERLLPAVMGLEAICQAASAVLGNRERPIFEEVRFTRPVAVPEDGVTRIRLAALVRSPGRVDVALRCATTGYQLDHFRATCLFGTPRDASDDALMSRQSFNDVGTELAIDPAKDLYGTILFHSGRFQGLRGYRQLEATACTAELEPSRPSPWFGRYSPPDMLLGDPGIRDAGIHAVQACIPQTTLLPIGIDRLITSKILDSVPHFVRAKERSHDGDTFVYDLDFMTTERVICERWEGLKLQAMQGATFGGPWVVPLLAPYLERRVNKLLPAVRVSFAVSQNGTGHNGHRHNGRSGPKPESSARNGSDRALPSDWCLVTAQAGAFSISVEGPGPLGFNLRPVASRPVTSWQDLLGHEQFQLAERIARDQAEHSDTAATRVWSALESLKKAGLSTDAPLVVAESSADSGLVLAAGPFLIATDVVEIRGEAQPWVLALATRNGHAQL
jgi:enediyne polyketide synthase